MTTLYQVILLLGALVAVQAALLFIWQHRAAAEVATLRHAAESATRQNSANAEMLERVQAENEELRQRANMAEVALIVLRAREAKVHHATTD